MGPQPRGVREIGRELALLSLFNYDVGDISLKELLDFEWYTAMVRFYGEEGELFTVPNETRKETFQFSWYLLNGTVSNLSRIDKVIEEHLVNWVFSRLHAIDKAILRLSIYSLLYQFDIPIEVVIAEANELSDKYSDENTSNYINGILNRVKNEYRKNFLMAGMERKTTTTVRKKMKLKKTGKK